MTAVGYLLSLLYAFACMGLSWLAHRLGLPKPYSRKIVHILVGFEWIILYHFFGAGLHFLIVCVFFTLLLYLVHRMDLAPMMSSDGDNAPGTVYYGVSMSLMALLTLWEPAFLYPFGIAVFCTSFGDGFAGVLGRLIRWGNRPIFRGKTWVGALSAFLFSLASVLVMSACFHLAISLWQACLIALFAAELELFTSHGLDNLTVPLGTAALSYAILTLPTVYHYILPILLTPLMIALVLSKRVLTPVGTACAVLADLSVSVALGNFGFALLAFFLISGVVLDRIKHRCRLHAAAPQGAAEAKSDRTRDAVQVLANGLIPSVAALLFLLTGEGVFVIAYVAALAEALGDTAASSIGALAGRAYDPFRRCPCTPGLSGGMSWRGTLASLLGAVAAAAVALAFRVVSPVAAALCVAAAFLGTVLDSCLGSVAQVKYRCPCCDTVTERRYHCGQPTVHERGLPFLNNDGVNFLSGLFAASLAAVAAIFFL